MRARTLVIGALVCVAYAATNAQNDVDLPVPTFHHVTVNSVDPDAAIAYYVKAFPDSRRTSWEGVPAVSAPNNALILFHRVAAPPESNPQVTAFWHFGWHVVDARERIAQMQSQGLPFAPLWTGIGDGSVVINSDSFPGKGGIHGFGQTRQHLAESVAAGLKPSGGPGFAYLAGPDGALVEVFGNTKQERFNHVHMWQDHPYCAQVWYQTHLNTPRRANARVYTQADCRVQRGEPTWPSLDKGGMYRAVTAGVQFGGDVVVNWYMNQTDAPLVGTMGRLLERLGLSVSDLDVWVSKLRAEGVTFIREPYRLGATRAVLIEGPSREAIELVEIR